MEATTLTLDLFGDLNGGVDKDTRLLRFPSISEITPGMTSRTDTRPVRAGWFSAVPFSGVSE
jgi:hypothetical protein